MDSVVVSPLERRGFGPGESGIKTETNRSEIETKERSPGRSAAKPFA